MDNELNDCGVLLTYNKHNFDVGKKKQLIIHAGNYKGKWYSGHSYNDIAGLCGSGSPICPKHDIPHDTEQEAINTELKRLIDHYKIEEAMKYLVQDALF